MKKSGSGQPKRSMRDKEIIDTWSFLCQHIVRLDTSASEDVRIKCTESPKYICIISNLSIQFTYFHWSDI